jgi:hemolysin activation/secretion protein
VMRRAYRSAHCGRGTPIANRSAALKLVVGVAALLLGLAADASALTQDPASPAAVAVTRFEVVGASVFSPAQLEAVLPPPHEGRSMTLGEIQAVAERVTALYRAHGYLLARAYVPEQDVVGGVVTIQVIEARVEGVDVQGARHYSPRLLRAYVQPEGAAIFNADSFERRALLLDDLPGLSVRSTLVPGNETGTTRVLLEVVRDRLLTGSLEVNNYGTATTGRERFSGALNVNNPFGIGDVFSLRAIGSSQDLWLVRAGYVAPVNHAGTRVGVSYLRLESPVGAQFSDLGIVGSGEMASAFATHPLVRSRAFSLYAHAGFDFKNFETEVLQETVARDRLRVLSAGLTAVATDRWRGLNNLSVTLFQGVGDALGGLEDDNDPHASRAGAGGEFTRVTADVSRLQHLFGSASLYLKAFGQLSSTRLVGPEQFIVGGQGSVRGYPLAELSGDSGYAGTLELRWNAPGFSDLPAFSGRRWGEVLQLFGFVDHGGVEIRAPGEGQRRRQDITGSGGGLRFVVPDRLQVSVEIATPVDGPPPSDKRRPVFYFQVVTLF